MIVRIEKVEAASLGDIYKVKTRDLHTCDVIINTDMIGLVEPVPDTTRICIVKITMINGYSIFATKRSFDYFVLPAIEATSSRDLYHKEYWWNHVSAMDTTFDYQLHSDWESEREERN